jgi:hypothetical protein
MGNFTKKPKNYLKGSAKLHEFSNGGHVIHVDILKSELEKLQVNKSGYIKITIGSLAKPDNWGNTHSIYENEFEPKAQGASSLTSAPKPQTGTYKKPTTDSLPF